jgi:hypothetical protein
MTNDSMVPSLLNLDIPGSRFHVDRHSPTPYLPLNVFLAQ